MTARARLAAFAVVLAVAFGGGWAVGATVGPDDSPAVVHHR
ncbi:MAG TPA: hypothetical protein VM938_04580 [Acidimicrobiales bacterium]|nr:hypothetical protein [Acidimicrobiales bacterium]